MITFLLALLGVFGAGFMVVFLRDSLRRRPAVSKKDGVTLAGIGFVTNFFDTLGIGSFAPTTALFRFFRLVGDRTIPGTLNVGHTLPVVVQAFVFITSVRVEPATLVVLLASAALGAVLGAGVVSRLPVRSVRLGLAVALLVVGAALLAGLLEIYPSGGEASGLSGWKLPVAAVILFGLGALQTIGVGFYAPCMALVYAMGMSPRAAFPIMMGACAFLMTSAGVRFVREDAYDCRAALGLAAGGVPAVLLAAYIVKSLPLTALKGLVIAVIVFTSVSLFRDAGRDVGEPAAVGPEAQRATKKTA
jgi:uncharacterized membrane protein YfcA